MERSKRAGYTLDGWIENGYRDREEEESGRI